MNVGTGGSNVVELDATSKLPAVDGSQLTNLNATNIASGTIDPARLPASASVWVASGNNIYKTNSGNVGIGTTAPTAALNIGAGTSTLAPLQLTAGSNLTTPLSGAIEYDGTSLYYTDSTATRHALAASGVPGSYLPLTGGTMTGAIVQVAGSANAPSLSFNTDQTTGFYSPGAGVVSIGTSGTERLRVTAAGNVGIGTTAPTNFGTGYTALQISATNGGVFRSAGTSGTPGNSDFYWDGSTGGSMIIRNTTASPISFQLAYAEKMRLSSTGNLGIGQVAPVSKLDVNGGITVGSYSGLNAAPANGLIVSGNVGIGTTTPANALDIGTGGGIHITTGTPTSTAAALYNNAGTLMWNGSSITTAATGIGGSGTTNYLPIYTAGNTLGNSPLYATGGNVGIGTTAPTHALDIAGTLNVTGIVTALSTNQLGTVHALNGAASAPSLSFTNGAAEGLFMPASNILGFATNGAEQMRIDSSGNVGIGTTAPAYKLDVAGQVNAAALSINGTTITAAGAGAWNTSGANINNTNTGNVGIGTTAPGASLVVATANNSPAYTPFAGTRAIFAGGSGSSDNTDVVVSAGSSGNASLDLGTYGTEYKGGISYVGSSSIIRVTNNGAGIAINSSGDVGIGTTSPTNLLSLDGQAAHTIWMERDTTASTAGQTLTLQGGGATSGSTDKNGGTLSLSSGIATGAGSSVINFNTSGGGTPGTTDSTPTTKMTIAGNGSVGLGVLYPSSSSKLEIAATSSGYPTILAYNSDWVAGSAGSGYKFTTGATSGVTYSQVQTYASGVAGGNLALNPSGGNVGIGTTSPSAILHLKAGGTVAGSSPLKFTSASTKLSTPEDGAMEYDGTNYYLTIGSTRTAIPLTGGSGSFSSETMGDGSASAPSINFLGDPTTGLYDVSTGVLGVSASGTQSATFSNTGVTIPATTASTNTTTGALVVGGGLGVSGAVNAATVSAASVSTLANSATAYAPTSASSVSPITGGYFSATTNSVIDSVGSYYGLQSKNAAGNYQRAYIGAISNTGASTYTPVLVFGQQTGSAAYAERMRIDVNGNVGIGTTAPSYQLTAQGSNNSTPGVLGLSSNQSATGNGEVGRITFNNNTNADVAQISGFRGGTNTSGFVTVSTANGSGLSERLRIDVGGNVGIGTTSPSAALNVLGQPASLPATTGTTTTGLVARFQPSNAAGTLDIGNGGSSGIWLQATNATNLTTNYPLLINPNGGSVGIGTTAPAYKLDVAGTIRTSTGGVVFPDGTTQTTAAGGGGSGQWGYTNPNVWYTAGNVGIGTTAPSSAFDLETAASPSGTGYAQAFIGGSISPTVSANNVNAVRSFVSVSPGSGINIVNARGLTSAISTGSAGGTVTNAFSIVANNPSYGSTVPTSVAGVYVANQGVAGVTTNIGLDIAPVSGATNNYAAIFESGNVGIGTTTPGAPLDITTSGNTGLVVHGTQTAGNTTSAGIYPNLAAGNYNGMVTAGDMALIYGGTTSTNPKGFVIAPWASATSGLRIDPAGNVGIGTTAPTDVLTVYSTSDTIPVHAITDGLGSSTMMVESYVSNVGGAGFTGKSGRGTYASPVAVQSGDRMGYFIGAGYTGSGFSNAASMETHVDAGTISSTSLPSYINFSTTPNGSLTRLERLRIDNAGNVGIGTTAPGATLDVSGHIANSAPGVPTLVNCASGTISGNDTRGVVTNANLNPCNVVFATAYATPPVCIVTPTVSLLKPLYVSSVATTGFAVSVSDGGSASFNYICMQ